MVHMTVTTADQMRRRSRDSAHRREAEAAEEEAVQEAVVQRTEREVRAEVLRRYRQEWLPKIGEAADDASLTELTIYAIGSADNEQELVWIKDEARTVLTSEGFGVRFHSEHRSHADDDRGREETDIIISWDD